ncbi:unnamed protein product [Onchocerca ochengi]|uniref:EGF-like domain-containing protein n=1 Tax=Onchocerca ochengi TaxID=42157 RepID=A0A182EDV9_ONCOC|nr:unnamed protein product [Onchocerca ochengi]
MAKLKNGHNGHCEPISVPLFATSRIIISPLASLFGRTCRCAFDWRSHFCKQIERYKSLLAIPEMQRHDNDQLPIVCICRCTCCFNQPNAFCNQLQCRNGEPIFDMHANTTCICHAPAFYPYNICAHQNSLSHDQGEVIISDSSDVREQSDYVKHYLHESSMHHDESTVTKLYGIQITPTSVIAIVSGLLGVIILLTVILLTVRSCRTQREHRNCAAKRELAQSILLEQRAEEEKYLP